MCLWPLVHITSWLTFQVVQYIARMSARAHIKLLDECAIACANRCVEQRLNCVSVLPSTVQCGLFMLLYAISLPYRASECVCQVTHVCRWVGLIIPSSSSPNPSVIHSLIDIRRVSIAHDADKANPHAHRRRLRCLRCSSPRCDCPPTVRRTHSNRPPENNKPAHTKSIILELGI